MKYTTARSITTLLFALATEVLAERVDINNYFRLISDVHKYYHTSCVIFADLDTTTLMHTWSREFSRRRVMTMTVTFADLVSGYNKYRDTIVRPLFVVLLDTSEAMSEFAKATRNIKPMSFPAWLVVFLQRPGNPLEKYCRHPAGNVFNVDFSTLMLVKCYDQPILMEWYGVHDNHTGTFKLATWSPSKGLLLRTRKSLVARRCDMFGEKFRVASVRESPFFSVENGGTIGGFLGLLLIELSRAMNFTMEILDPVDAYGSWNQQRNMWTGVIGQLVVGKADIGVSEFTLMPGRMDVVDFTLPLIHSRSRLYFKQPDSTDVHWSGYFQAFSSGIWIMIVTIIITASILLTVMKAKKCFSASLLFENYMRVWGIFCQQSLSEFPNELSMRLAFFSIYVSAFIISSAYSASLISYLTLTTVSLPFSTLEDYIKDGSYKLIITKDSVDYDVIKVSRILQIQKILNLKKTRNRF
ncbi:hypothetical protein X777_11479 [Ooceraea biroi]|uniref:Ionotropic glutamate receptor L-glutamate and glycine-binding domain-containing protein n=1 Tax=Ooceraea biroi TaxID=2015173 RepID=A0A026W327_OOCBI|nr:hypothetical protein X777_11479 [Ooceraea biroi]